MIQTREIIYSNKDNEFQGVLAWDEAIEGERPLILVCHTFRGQLEFEAQKAKELAAMGYLAFAIDVYGKGRRASNREEAEVLLGEMEADRSELLKRLQLALETGKQFELTDTSNIAAIGFCFGGKSVLDLARSGIHINGVVSFHGVYDKPDIDYSKPIRTSILVLHGWDDPLATPDQTVALAEELTERKADWSIHAFGHTGHAFTNPVVNLPEIGMFYQEKSNTRAWKAMQNFFEEVFYKV